jgi:hypothetical protein
VFQRNELARLQERKALLVLQSEANRQKLAADWSRLSSAGWWLDETGRLMQRHPVLTAALGATAGAVAVRMLRRPGKLIGRFGQVLKLGSLAISGWKFVNR